MSYKKGDIVTGKVSVGLPFTAKKSPLVEVKFIGKVSDYNPDQDLYTLKEAVITDLDMGWNNLDGGIQEYGGNIVSLCTAEDFDTFHDNLRLPKTHPSQYWSNIGVSMRLIMANLFDD